MSTLEVKSCISALEVKDSMHVDLEVMEPCMSALEVKETIHVGFRGKGTMHVGFRGKGSHACRL